jgi:hypothetical protein
MRYSRAAIPALLALSAGLAVLGGQALATAGRFEFRDNLLFEADCRRVIENTTELFGPQDRARIHPLHVSLMILPGYLLSRALGNAELSTVILTAAAGCLVLYNLASLLRNELSLGRLHTFVFVGIAAASASQITFAMVPDTHILSAVGLSGLATSLSEQRARRMRESRGPLEWLRGGGSQVVLWSTLAVGMLGTNLPLVLLALLLVAPQGRPRGRVLAALAAAASVFAIVLGLHLIQRRTLPPAQPTAPTAHDASAKNEQTLGSPPASSAQLGAHSAPEPPRAPGLVGYAKSTWHHNSRWITPPDRWLERGSQAAYSALVVTFFAPNILFQKKPWADLEMASFEPWALELWTAGVPGVVLWVGLCAFGAVKLARLSRHRSALSLPPLLTFSLATVGLYWLIVALYGDELFLYSPNWMFAVVVLAGRSFQSLLRTWPTQARKLEIGLVLVLGSLLANSFHFFAQLSNHFL